MDKPTVFVSYSHKDEEWKDRLRPFLKALVQAGRIVLWDDRQIDGGSDWYDEIRQALERASVAVCLVSQHFLASDFCIKEEVAKLVERQKAGGLVLLPLLLRPCPWELFDWLTATQMIPRDGKTLESEYKGKKADAILNDLAKLVAKVVDRPAGRVVSLAVGVQAPAPPRWSPPEKIDITRLPATGMEVFGRQAELALLDQAWESDTTHVVSLVAWGGVGKSTLVNKWLERFAADHYRGARRVFGWSFYSQGTNDRVTSADLFISEALTFFGDPDPTAGSPWDKGERLADLVRKEKSLLLLDGMEPLQSPLEFERGQVKDPALATLLIELARDNPGLCVITTREAVADLRAFPQAISRDLEQISPEAGRALLRIGGVRGTDTELEQASRAFGNHALALNLLAAYLRDIPGHHVSHGAEVPDLDVPVEAGKHPRRLLAAFERRFDAGPEIEFLRMLGLFDRPASAGEVAALLAAPAIEGLTARLQELDEAGRLRLVAKLRDLGLIAPASHHQPDALDAHPLIREHFGQQLREASPAAWQEGNGRLYEHLKQTAKESPETLEEMSPLLAAVTHGCRAGRHQEALEEVYWRRVLQSKTFFITRNLGAYAADLAVLHSFFDSPWQQPVTRLTEGAQAFLLNSAGHRLQALGRLAEAIQPMQAGLEAKVREQDWNNAAISASNLSELDQLIGDLPQALIHGQEAVELADRSGNPFQRMVNRTTLAAALHASGRLPEAEALFREAEVMQKERQPSHPVLYPLPGYRYCDLLLDRGEFQDVQDRTGQTLRWVELQGWLLTIALDHLSLGRAHWLRARHEGTGDDAQAMDYLERAVTGLRRAGDQSYLPLGLLAHAELYRGRGDLERARRDIDAALTIAERGGMGLHQADGHLASARLHLARGAKDEARRSLATARAMIERMGYHRRDGEVAELERKL